ncbi:alpha/beta hydrolase [Paenibacillus sp. IB182496]|uniref:Alpha/beta hydrolase n=1 Tax=Paenibacillus sabuli TaxID=2772509 RepID=A0A927BXL0_9BACL|nr:alpha/beta fold hydrolase [Paenibacillus sabuli]MBD2847465.1 alpha/beta hydrolase [Paenibacillus sabuli]
MLLSITTSQGNIQAIIDNMDSFNDIKDTILVYCYGFNGERSDRHRMAVKLSRQLKVTSIAVLRFDYLGLGISDGDFVNVTLKTKLKDTLAVIRFIERRIPQISNIIFLGFSDGASIAMASLTEYAGRLNILGLLLWSPVLQQDIPIIKTNMHLKGENTKSNDSELFSYNWDKEIRSRPVVNNKEIAFPVYGLWKNIKYSNLNDTRSIRTFIKRKVPTCIICPEGDDLVVPTARRLLRDLRGNATIHHILNSDHTFNHSDWEAEVRNHSYFWIRGLLDDSTILDK